MNKTAYVMMRLQWMPGNDSLDLRPRISYRVASQAAGMMTCHSTETYVDICDAKGKDYGDAHDKAVEMAIKYYRHQYKYLAHWLLNTGKTVRILQNWRDYQWCPESSVNKSNLIKSLWREGYGPASGFTLQEAIDDIVKKEVENVIASK